MGFLQACIFKFWMETLYHPFRQELFDWTISVNPAANVQICCLAPGGPCVRDTPST